MGLRGGHFAAIVKEFATILVTRPGGCALLQGPFALSINGALLKILNTWGSASHGLLIGSMLLRS
jgi:hypothetical protein